VYGQPDGGGSVRIGVDARALTGFRGVTRYARALLEALAREYPQDEWLLFTPGRAELPAVGALCAMPNISLRRHRLPGRALFGAAAIAGRPRLDRLVGGSPEVVWAPTIAPMALSAKLPLVLTVQDLSFELRPQDFTAYERVWHSLARPRALARRARFVIVLAEPTREQLIARWGLAPAGVRVVPAGVRVVPAGVRGPEEPLDPTGALDRFGLVAEGYLLAVGALEPRKAPLLLAGAFARARQRGLRAELVFAGEGRLAGRLVAPGVRLLGRVSDLELDALYAGALALVMPSLLEGYGLPVREALARGTPAVISDLPVFGDELSGAVLRVPVGDQAALADALLRITDEEGPRRAMARAGEAAVAGLTWAAAARKTRAVLAEACAAGG
jgi:glycosyltransferase involved in cell wall biosynthesis